MILVVVVSLQIRFAEGIRPDRAIGVHKQLHFFPPYLYSDPLISLACIAVAGMSARGVETLLQVTVKIPPLMFLAWP